MTDIYHLDTDDHLIRCVGCGCQFQKENLILHKRKNSQVIGRGSRLWRHNQVEAMMLKLCKEVGYQVDS